MFRIQARTPGMEWGTVAEADSVELAGALLAGHLAGSLTRGLNHRFRVMEWKQYDPDEPEHDWVQVAIVGGVYDEADDQA